MVQLPKCTLELYDRLSARPLELKIRMLRVRVKVLETIIILYGCVTWRPRACHYDTLRRANHDSYQNIDYTKPGGS